MDRRGYGRSAGARGLWVVAVAVVIGGVPGRAGAFPGGYVGTDCGCHAYGSNPITLTPTPADFGPGDTVTFALATEGTGVTAGASVEVVTANGTLSTVSGGGLSLRGSGLSHTSPRPLEDPFEFAWTAPDEPGSVRFLLASVLANGNGASSGDQFSRAVYDFVFGCTAHTFYIDLDGDGFGQRGETWEACEWQPPEGFASTDDDCDDYRAWINPGASEQCDGVDEDCDGIADNGFETVMQVPDADGDGFYGALEATSDEAHLGCFMEGFATQPGDCQPYLADAFPGATEVCNGYDDNCDGRIDEGLVPYCGVGQCIRVAPSCDPEACEPGPPSPEVCNRLDDDCDGVIDNDAPCPPGETCEYGRCVSPVDGTETTDGGSTDDDDGRGADADTATTSSGPADVAVSESSEGLAPSRVTNASTPPAMSAGCDCRTSPRDATRSGWWLLALLAFRFGSPRPTHCPPRNARRARDGRDDHGHPTRAVSWLSFLHCGAVRSAFVVAKRHRCCPRRVQETTRLHRSWRGTRHRRSRALRS